VLVNIIITTIGDTLMNT